MPRKKQERAFEVQMEVAETISDEELTDKIILALFGMSAKEAAKKILQSIAEEDIGASVVKGEIA